MWRKTLKCSNRIERECFRKRGYRAVLDGLTCRYRRRLVRGTINRGAGKKESGVSSRFTNIAWEKGRDESMARALKKRMEATSGQRGRGELGNLWGASTR